MRNGFFNLLRGNVEHRTLNAQHRRNFPLHPEAPHPCPMTYSLPLVRPSRASASRIPFVASQATQVLLWGGEGEGSFGTFRAYLAVQRLAGSHGCRMSAPGASRGSRRSLWRILDEVERRRLKTSLPTREVYLKGPGMIFKGNPKNYLTEIQLPIGG